MITPVVYEELHRIAEAYFRGAEPSHTLQPTALVHEAYLKLAGSPGFEAKDRKHFYVVASHAMRQILVDHARAKSARKRRNEGQRVTLSEAIADQRSEEVDVLALDDALIKLHELNPDRALLVELRFFGGLTSEDAGEVLGISRTEAARRWRTTKLWLATELRESATE